MSNPPVAAPTFPRKISARLRPELLSPAVVAPASVAVILAIASISAALRGPWLDEFWTLELSDGRKGLPALVRDGWLHDVHPPVFNAWAYLLASLGVDSIPVGRLASNLLAAGLLIVSALRLSRRTPEQATFAACLLLLVLSLPPTMESFGVYRSYFWQIAAIGALVLIAHHVAIARTDLRGRRDIDLAAIAAVATAGSMGLHYVGGLFGGLLAAAVALCAFKRGLRRWAALVLASAALSSLFVLASIALQASNWAVELDHRWIDPSFLGALSVLAAVAVTPLWQIPVPLVGLWIGKGVDDATEARFVVMIGGVLLGGVAIVLTVNAVEPIVVDRYLFVVPVLISALMAMAAARVVHDRRLFGVLALLAVASAARPTIEAGIKPHWRQDAQTIANIVAECPTTQVYAASGWALGPAAGSRMARREDPVFERAYRSLANQYGYTIGFIGQNGSAQASPGSCPVLLWYAHTPNEAENDLPAAIEAAGLTGLGNARLSVSRSATGFVVRADRP